MSENRSGLAGNKIPCFVSYVNHLNTPRQGRRVIQKSTRDIELDILLMQAEALDVSLPLLLRKYDSNLQPFEISARKQFRNDFIHSGPCKHGYAKCKENARSKHSKKDNKRKKIAPIPTHCKDKRDLNPMPLQLNSTGKNYRSKLVIKMGSYNKIVELNFPPLHGKSICSPHIAKSTVDSTSSSFKPTKEPTNESLVKKYMSLQYAVTLCHERSKQTRNDCHQYNKLRKFASVEEQLTSQPNVVTPSNPDGIQSLKHDIESQSIRTRFSFRRTASHGDAFLSRKSIYVPRAA